MYYLNIKFLLPSWFTFFISCVNLEHNMHSICDFLFYFLKLYLVPINLAEGFLWFAKWPCKINYMQAIYIKHYMAK